MSLASHADEAATVATADPGRPLEHGSPARHRKLCWALIALAVALRLIRYLHDRGLWLDEVYLALNLVNRSFSDLTLELDDQQYVPLGFLIVMKLCVVAFGRSEYALRLVPFLVSLVSVYLFYELAKRVLKSSAVPLALLLFAVSFPLLIYAAEAKVYGADASVAIGLVLLATTYGTKDTPRIANALFLAFAGASAVWFSFPAAFVLAGAGLTLGAGYLLRRAWRSLGLLSLVIAIWSISFAAQAWLLLGRGEPQMPTTDLRDLQNYYSEDFLPWPPNPAAVTEWLMSLFSTVTGYFTSDAAAGLGVFAFVMGCIPLAKSKRQALAMLTVPLVITLLVSATHFYPTRDRFMVFIGPALILVMAAGLDEIRTRVGPRGTVIWVVLLTVMLFQPCMRAIKQSISPERHGDSRAAIARLDENFREGDFIYLHWTADPQYRFYSKKTQPPENVIAGTRSERWEVMQRDLDRLSGRPRVWVLFSFNAHTIPVGRFVRDYLGSKGRLLDTFESQRAALYLYDMSGSTNPPPS
jgi:hypothetical protein